MFDFVPNKQKMIGPIVKRRYARSVIKSVKNMWLDLKSAKQQYVYCYNAIFRLICNKKFCNGQKERKGHRCGNLSVNMLKSNKKYAEKRLFDECARC